jgi:hypothetical protein
MTIRLKEVGMRTKEIISVVVALSVILTCSLAFAGWSGWRGSGGWGMGSHYNRMYHPALFRQSSTRNKRIREDSLSVGYQSNITLQPPQRKPQKVTWKLLSVLNVSSLSSLFYEILDSFLLPFFSAIVQVAGKGLKTSQALCEIFTTMHRKPNNINPSREILGR